MQALHARHSTHVLLISSVLILSGCAGHNPRADAPPPRAPGDRNPDRHALLRPAQAAPEYHLPDQATLHDLLAYAEANNPGLRAARLGWQAETQAVPQARALPDPTLSLGYQDMDRETRIGITQMFPLGDKRRLRAQVAGDTADAARARYAAQRLELFEQVSRAYAEHAYVHRAAELIEANLLLVRQLEQVALARVRAGGPQADALRAQIELARIEDEWRTITDMLRPTAAALNAALGRPAEATLPEPVPAQGDAIPQEVDELRATLAQANPQLRTLQHEMTRARREMELARRENWPDLMVGVDYMRQPDMDGFGAMVSVNLPVWRDRIRAQQRQAQHRFHAASEMLIQQQNELESELSMALFRLRDAERKLSLYQEQLLPRAHQSLQATEAAYRAGAVDFLALVEAYRLPLEFELALVRATADRDAAVAIVRALLGEEIATQDTTDQPEGE